MKNQNFGIEIEFTNITRKESAEVIAKYFNTTAKHIGGSYDTYEIKDDQDRKWKIVNDSSIRAESKTGAPTQNHKVELVSPICRYEDIEKIQEITRLLRKNKARANNSCGLHLHIDATPHNAKTLRNITNIMASKEDLIYRALQVEVEREHRYCQKVETEFLEELNRKKPQSVQEMKEIWYKGFDGSDSHYHQSRYRALNLHSVFQKGTIEFRLFNSTLAHAGKIKAYIQFCLAVSNQALNQSCASRKKTETTNPKYTFRTWLLRLGLIGDEYKTARTHLLANLPGDIAWRDRGTV